MTSHRRKLLRVVVVVPPNEDIDNGFNVHEDEEDGVCDEGSGGCFSATSTLSMAGHVTAGS